MDSAAAGQRLDESLFQLPADLLALAAPAVAAQEQAAPNALAGGLRASWEASKGSMLVADTYAAPADQRGRQQQQVQEGPLSDPLRRSVNSRPLASFGQAQAAASLHTQSPSVKHSLQGSVRWQAAEAGAGVSQAAISRPAAAAAAALPAQLERRHQEEGKWQSCC